MTAPVSGSAGDPYSYLMPYGYMNSLSCGYCRQSTDTKGYMLYVSAKSLKASFYQTLADRCWRRSGSLVYRPNQRKACCPHYAVRLDAIAYRPTKDHRQTLNRFNRHIVGDEYTKLAQRVSPLSRAEAKLRSNTFDLRERLHEAEEAKLPRLQPKKSGAEPVGPAHRFVVTLEDDKYTDEKYAIFENYQRIIHKEEPHRTSPSIFTNFLCNSPIRPETVIERDPVTGATREKKLGSFHQCYYLDGKLVAVGVLDLLPHSVSAVYFMYHESIHEFSPGKLSAMREIALAIEGGYNWWYSGFYIARCPKMRYKLSFAPQYVLDPETCQWDLFDKATQDLYDRQLYVSLSRERRLAADPGLRDKEEAAEASVSEGGDDDPPRLFASNMPALPSVDEVAAYDLERVRVWTSFEKRAFPVEYLMTWETTKITDNTSLKCKLAEIVSMMGEDLIPEICLDYRD